MVLYWMCEIILDGDFNGCHFVMLYDGEGMGVRGNYSEKQR